MFSGSATSLSFLSPSSSTIAHSLLPIVARLHAPRHSFFLSPSLHSFRLQNDGFPPENWTRNYSTAALPFDLSPPPIDHDLIDTMKVAGAKVLEDDRIETYGNDDEALNAIENGVVVGA